MKTQLQFLKTKPQTILHFGKVGWRLLFLKHVVLHCAVPPFLSCSKAGVPNSAPWDQCYGGRDDEKSDGHLDDYGDGRDGDHDPDGRGANSTTSSAGLQTPVRAELCNSIGLARNVSTKYDD